MPASARPIRGTARFGVFEADLASGEVRKQGRRLRLQGQPFEVLTILLERPGDLITREELRQRLWPPDVVVDFDHSLNKAVNKLRDALGDSAESPRYIETLPRRGYRLLVQVEWIGLDATDTPVDAVETAPRPDAAAVAPSSSTRRAMLGLAATAISGGAVWWVWPRATGAPPRPGRVMLVVLPFRNVSGEPAEEYFSDGLTEEMIAQLGRIQPARLAVIAATSAQRYKGSSKTLADIARELSVDFVLEGSVRREGDRVRITGQLVQASDQTQLWSDTYERELADVFQIQTDVAQRIAHALAVELLPPQQKALAHQPTRNAGAHEAYLRGRFEYSKRTRAALVASIAFFERAVAEDPAFALGYVGIADALNLLAEYGHLSPKDAFPRSLGAARHALALEPDLVEAQANLGWTTYAYLRELREADALFARAIATNPGYVSTYQWQASSLRAQRRHREADAAIARAQELDPVSPIIQAVAGWHHYLARRYDASIAQCRRVIEATPDFPRVYSYLGWALVKTGGAAEAAAALERALQLSGDSAARRAELAHGYASAGRGADARRLLDALLMEAGREYVEADLVARVFVALGETDRAFEWLERGVSERAVKMILLGVDPAYDDIRGDPRFGQLLRRLGVADDA